MNRFSGAVLVALAACGGSPRPVAESIPDIADEGDENVTPPATPDIRAAEAELEAADARGALETLARADETNARTFFTRGLAHDFLGEADAALTAYARAVELEPRFAMAHANYAAVALDGERYRDALAHANEALRLDSSSAGARVTRALAYEATGDLAHAIADLRAALSRGHNIEVRAHLARVLEASGARDEAVAEYRTIATTDDADEQLLLVAAEGLRRSDELPGAGRALSRAIERAPNDASLHASLALVERERGNRDSAERAIRQAIALAGDRVEYRYVLAGFLAAAERYADAVIVYREALSVLGRSPENDDLRRRIESRLAEAERRSPARQSSRRARN